jgi:hypothetical protein
VPFPGAGKGKAAALADAGISTSVAHRAEELAAGSTVNGQHAGSVGGIFVERLFPRIVVGLYGLPLGIGERGELGVTPPQVICDPRLLAMAPDEGVALRNRQPILNFHLA